MSQRVPASEVLQIYEKVRGRPGQVHGVPRLASSLIKLRDLDEYEEAELVRKKIEACFTAFVKGPGRDLPLSDNVQGGQHQEQPAANRNARARHDHVRLRG
jgi:capsid protein